MSQIRSKWPAVESAYVFILSVWLGGAICSSAEAYRWRRDMVHVDFVAPPVVLHMVDAEGRRIGVDFTLTLAGYGIGWEVQEFEHGFVMQDNMGNEDEESPDYGKPAPQTHWDCTIFDGGMATYDLVYRGMIDGQSALHMGVTRKPADRRVEQWVELEMPFLVEEGVERRIRMTVDPQAQTIKAVRVVSATEMESDIGLACRLGLITPDGMCHSLSAKARAIADARARGRVQAARGATKAFLNELKAQDGKHVKEPALTILREEAEALLNPPAPMPKPKKLKAGGAPGNASELFRASQFNAAAKPAR